jgi:branched-chain amino acid transport system ATP-binding protein
MLQVEQLSAGYGALTALDGVSFAASPGSITAVLGPNGAGKSTLVRCLAGVHPHGGIVSVDGKELRPSRVRDRVRARLTAVSDRRDLVPSLSVRRYLSLVLDDGGRRRALGLFPELAALERRRCGVLSGGEAQMVALARAVGAEPAVLVVDEISQGLAPVVLARLLPALLEAAQQGAAVVLVEQYVHLARAVADRVVVLDRGSVRYDGAPDGAPIDDVYLAQEGRQPAISDDTTGSRTSTDVNSM